MKEPGVWIKAWIVASRFHNSAVTHITSKTNPCNLNSAAHQLWIWLEGDHRLHWGERRLRLLQKFGECTCEAIKRKNKIFHLCLFFNLHIQTIRLNKFHCELKKPFNTWQPTLSFILTALSFRGQLSATCSRESGLPSWRGKHNGRAASLCGIDESAFVRSKI